MWGTVLRWIKGPPAWHKIEPDTALPPMSQQVMGETEPAPYLDLVLTKLVWEKALRSKDPAVAEAIQQLWSAIHDAEKK